MRERMQQLARRAVAMNGHADSIRKINRLDARSLTMHFWISRIESRTGGYMRGNCVGDGRDNRREHYPDWDNSFPVGRGLELLRPTT